MPENILLSVALVTRNRPKSLDRCLRSLRSQSIQPLEVVISDDSGDEFVSEVKAIADYWDCRYISGPRRGLYANRNHVALVCKGTHIRTMDDDHEFPEQHIEICLDAVQSDPSSVWFIGEYTPTQKIGNTPHPCPGQLHPRGFSFMPKDTQNCWAIADGASIYPKKIFESGLRFVEYYKFGASYLEWGSRLYYLGYRIRHLDSTYIIHHFDPQNRSFMDREIDQSSRLFAMLCHSLIYQSNFKNQYLLSYEIFKQFVFSPRLTTKCLRQSWLNFKLFSRTF